MYRKGRKNNNSIFLNLIFPYACVLIIPMMVWFFSNIYINKTNESKLMSFSKANIESNISTVDSALDQIENVVTGISQNEGFDSFYTQSQPTYAEKLKYQKMLASYNSQLGQVKSIYIYSKMSDIVITPDAIYENPEEFFRYANPLSGFSAQKWAEDVRNDNWGSGYSHQKLISNTDKKVYDILSYARNVPIEYITKRHGVVGVYLDEDELLRGFNALLKEGKGELYVFNKKGKLIMSTGEKYTEHAYDEEDDSTFTKVRLDGENFYKLTCMGEKNQWQYIVFIAGDYVLKEMIVVNNILNVINIVALIIGLLLCFYFTYGRNKSYLQILNILGIENEVHTWGLRFNEFDMWKPHLGNLIDENKKIKENVRELTETERYKTLNMLLSDFQGSNEDARLLAEKSGFDFQGQKFLVMVLKSPSIYNVDGINNKNLFLKQVLKEYITEEFYLYIENSKSTAVIINYDMDTEEMHLFLKEQIAKMNLDVFYRYHVEFVWGISEERVNLSEIGDAYREASEVVRYNKLMDSNDILYFRDLPTDTLMYDYPIELENKFIQAISSGKAEEALKVVDKIYESNFEKRTLSAKRTAELFGEISSTMNKIKLSYFKDEEPTEYKFSDFTVKRFFEYVRDFAYSLCESVKISDENAYKTLSEGMIAYINENYAKSELSLSVLAEEFGFTNISYISRSFKSFFNENFSSYVEKIRMEKACEMLLDGMQIKEVSEKVGYISDVTFRRAFKKRMGLSPTDYVKNSNKMKINAD